MVRWAVPGRFRLWSGDAIPGSWTRRRLLLLSSLLLPLSSTWRWRGGAGQKRAKRAAAAGTRGGGAAMVRVYLVRACRLGPLLVSDWIGRALRVKINCWMEKRK
jgi:hypothetical protein